MQFLREIWFLLVSSPALYDHYAKNAILVVFFFLLSVATFVVEHWFPKQHKVLVWVRRISLGLTSLLFILAFVDTAKNRLPFDELVCSDVAVDAYYHLPEDKSYELVQRQHCINRTDHPIRELRELRDGYYEKIPDWTVDGDAVQAPFGVKLVFIEKGETEYKNYIGDQTVYQYWRKPEFNLPLPSGADVDMVYRISAKGVPIEAGAFSQGTVFYRGVDYDTLILNLAIHAPAGYRFELQDWGVVDSKGHRDSSETDRQKEPQVMGSGGNLEWRVILARRHLSYMLKYKILAFGWK